MADDIDEIIRSTGYWSTAIRYKELEGSGGQEMTNEDSNRSTRKFWVRWEDSIAFGRELLGGTSQVGAALQVRTLPKKDPDRTFLTCQSVKTTGIKNIGESDGVIQYAIAEIEATFAPPKTPDGNGDENQESVTYLTESWDVQKNLFPRKGWFFYWKEGSQVDKVVGEDANLTDEQIEIKISIDVHKWYNPPLLDMLMAINKVNDRPHRLTFVTFPTGTLKFNNVKPSYELTDEGVSPFKVSLEYAFIPNGWNKVYCPQDAEFREIGSAFDDPPFLPYNFDLLIPAGIV